VAGGQVKKKLTWCDLLGNHYEGGENPRSVNVAVKRILGLKNKKKKTNRKSG